MKSILDQVRPETAEIIGTHAKASGLSVDEYLRRLISMTSPSSPEHDADDFMAAMESLADDTIKPLATSFSRKDIYFPED